MLMCGSNHQMVITCMNLEVIFHKFCLFYLLGGMLFSLWYMLLAVGFVDCACRFTKENSVIEPSAW